MVSIENILREAVSYDGADIKRINHFLKVYAFAKMIGEGEGLSSREQYILEAAAVLHDIGIHESERKYSSSAGKYQEIEGPEVARNILESLQADNDVIDRVCYLIGHHHTYNQVDGLDYQILIEADFFVNANEDNMSPEAVRKVYEQIFKTETGKMLFEKIYLCGNSIQKAEK